jgi:transposase
MGMRRIAPNFENCSLEQIQSAEKNSTSNKAARRLQSLRLLFQGRTYEDVLAVAAVTPRTLSRWIKRFNTYGIDGLTHDAERPGRPTKIPLDKQEAFKDLLKNPYQLGRDFWTARALHGHLSEQWKIQLGYSTVCLAMHQAGFDLKSPRPWPGLRQDPDQRALFVQEIDALLADPNVDVFFGDETGIEGDPKPRRRWAQKGVVTTVPYTGDHVRENVIGAVLPKTGELLCHVVPYVDSEWFGLFIKELADRTRKRHETGRRIVLVLDNASWHKVKSLPWQHLEVKYLPPYSPDYNPIEHLWLTLKSRWFNNRHCNTHEALAQRVDEALRSFLAEPHTVRSICGGT